MVRCFRLGRTHDYRPLGKFAGDSRLFMGTDTAPILWTALGWTRLEGLGGGKTRVYFRETYEVFNPLMRALLEKRVHDFISEGNDKLIEAGLVRALKKLHERRQ